MDVSKLKGGEFIFIPENEHKFHEVNEVILCYGTRLRITNIKNTYMAFYKRDWDPTNVAGIKFPSYYTDGIVAEEYK